eukprot:10174783-Lingulodinium_polyedra.AAC.1
MHVAEPSLRDCVDAGVVHPSLRPGALADVLHLELEVLPGVTDAVEVPPQTACLALGVGVLRRQ